MFNQIKAGPLFLEDEIDQDWNLYHDMQNRDYKDVTEIAKLKLENAGLKAEVELLKSWVNHHGKAWQIRMQQQREYSTKIKDLESRLDIATEAALQKLKTK